MRISMNIVEKNLKDIVKDSAILESAGMSLVEYEVFDSDTCSYLPSCLYICESKELPQPSEIPDGSSFICLGEPPVAKVWEYRHMNLLVAADISFKKLLNAVHATFKKYRDMRENLENMITSKVPMREIIDLATDIIEQPLCMIDFNHNSLALSSRFDSPEDPLWDAMKAGYGYSHYDIVKKSLPKLDEMVKTPDIPVERISNISGHYIYVQTLLRGNRPIAFLGMHKKNDFQAPFDKATVQLFHYVVNKLTKRLNLFSDVKESRGLAYEQLLLDITDGKIKDAAKIKENFIKLGLDMPLHYQFGLISFIDGLFRTEYHFAMMDYIELIVPNSKCFMYESQIAVVCPQDKDNEIPKNIQNKFAVFLKSQGCFCVLSSISSTLTELPILLSQVKTGINSIRKKPKDKYLFHYHEFAEQHMLMLVSDRIPTHTLCHPMLKKLMQYDSEHGTDFFETFKEFLKNNCNVTEASKVLHMHRNSLLYRITRIKELLEDDFSSWETRRQLLFSISCIEYGEINRSHE